jgi:signal transduction histidine kinase
VTIRRKLLLGFGFYTLFSLALGFFAYRELRAVAGRLTLVEAADDLTSTMLEVRRYEKNFLLYADPESARSLRRYVADLRAGVGRIEAEIGREFGPERFRALRGAIDDYEATFLGLEQLRRQPDAPGRQAAEAGRLEKLRGTARDLQAFAEELSRRERVTIGSLLQRSQRSIRLLLLAVLAAIALDVLINVQLSRSIADPIKRLEGVSRKIAGGDFSERVSVGDRGGDEVASLGRSFNEMQDRLHETLTTLALANESLRANRAQLVAAEKLATLGRFSVGVAHEINNPLAIINEKAGLMQDLIAAAPEFAGRDRFSGLLDAISQSVARASTITHRILDFSRDAAPNTEAIDLGALVGEVLAFFEPALLAKKVLLDLELREGLPALASDRARIRQSLAAIVQNAIEAVGTGGKIRVATAAKDAGTLQVVVEDDGPGIPPEMLGHLFEPFFTLGKTGKGAGLGLAISYGLVKKLGGDILVRSEPGRGTAFTVELPLRGRPADPPPA